MGHLHPSVRSVFRASQLKGDLSPAETMAWANGLVQRMIDSGGLDPADRGRSSLRRCPECAGRGWVGTEADSRYCDNCRYGFLTVPDDTCLVCHGAEWVKAPGARESSRCPACGGEEAVIAARLAATGMPRKYRGLTLQGWGREIGYAPAMRAAHEFLDATMRGGDLRPGLLLTGGTGVGKSGLAAGLVRELVPHFECRWIPWVRYCDDLAQLMRDGQSIQQVIKRDAEAGLLVIDDIAADGVDSAFRTRILHDLLEQRWGLPTIITAMYGVDELAPRLGDHVMGRVVELCRPVPVIGIDQRRSAA